MLKVEKKNHNVQQKKKLFELLLQRNTGNQRVKAKQPYCHFGQPCSNKKRRKGVYLINLMVGLKELLFWWNKGKHFRFFLETFTVPHKTLAPSDSHKTRSEPDNLQSTLWPRNFLLQNGVLHLADNNNADGSVFNNERCARTDKYPLFPSSWWHHCGGDAATISQSLRSANKRNAAAKRAKNAPMHDNSKALLIRTTRKLHDNSETLLKQPESCKICRRMRSVRIGVRFSKLHSPLLTTDPSVALKKKPVRTLPTA